MTIDIWFSNCIVKNAISEVVFCLSASCCLDYIRVYGLSVVRCQHASSPDKWSLKFEEYTSLFSISPC